MSLEVPEQKYYPSGAEVVKWIEELWEEADRTHCQAELVPEQGFSHSMGVRHLRGYQYVRFSPSGMDDFYGYWQPAISGPAPLLVHTPGYGAEVSIHPDLVMQGYSVLHINPLGYASPSGPDESKMRDGSWPVLADTVTSRGQNGYRQWLINCILAIRWAQAQAAVIPERLSFFGSSQGGGCSLLLGSLYKDRGVRCVAADVAYLADFLLAKGLEPDARGAYEWALSIVNAMQNPADGWYALGLIDVMSHASRLTMPVLLTAGRIDQACPAANIESLFERLPGTKAYCNIKDQNHGYTTEFIALAASWFRLYA